MNEIYLNSLELKTFTEQDVLDYCLLNDINPDDIIKLWLHDNELTDISGIKLFKNLKHLYLYFNQLTDISIIKNLKLLQDLSIGNNQITDISILKYLKKLKKLGVSNLELESDQIQYIKSLNNLKELWCRNGFKNKSVLNQLDKNIKVIK